MSYYLLAAQSLYINIYKCIREEVSEMSRIVLISGSPSEDSRSAKVLDFIGTTLQHEGYDIEKIAVTDIPAEDLMYGRYDSDSIKRATETIQKASGIVIASPVYKAAYTGVLKSFLDILPQDILQHKVVLPIMTGGSPNHLLALTYALKPVISVLKGHSLNGVYIVDDKIDKESQTPIIDNAISERIDKQLNYFYEALQQKGISVYQ